MLASRSIIEDARQVMAPTLLLWGARDRTIPPRLAPQFIERLPGATLYVMEGSFHEMATPQPQETARIIHDFISRAKA
jgi:pimeloyl-ACP methyl ester carboxylesterase